jgi:hypothetical protein
MALQVNRSCDLHGPLTRGATPTIEQIMQTKTLALVGLLQTAKN